MPPRPLGIQGAVVVTAALLFMEILFMSPVTAFSDKLADSPIISVSIYLSGLVMFKLIIVFFGVRSRKILSDTFEHENFKNVSKIHWNEVLWVLASVLIFRLLYDATLGKLLLELIPQSDALTSAFEFLFQAPLLAGGYIIFVAPFYEEFIFRTVILGGLRTKGYSMITAVLVSSVLFGAIHLNLLQGIHAFLLALLLGGIYLKTGSFFLVLLAHVASNLFVWFTG